MESNSIINSLKRLERAGSTTSKASEKLCRAAEEVAQAVANLIPTDYAGIVTRNYRADYSNVGKWRLFYGDQVFSESSGVPRELAMRFAEDIAGGLIDEIAQWLEDESKRASEATSKIEEAKFKL